MTDYYSAKHDQDDSVSAFAKNRAATQRKYGIPDADIGRLETMLPFAAMTNTVPSLFWLFSFVMSQPDLATQVREEVERAIAKRIGDEVVVMASPTVVEEKCPLLWSCYRETLRLTVHQVSTRTVLQDTTISDGAGREYLLKEGTTVQMATGFLGALEEYWGPNYSEFEPTRFVNYADRSRADGPGSGKAMRTAFLPFGGGAHLCPGRMFAAAEMMAFMATMLLGYEVEPQNGKWELPPFGARSIIDAVTKPARNGDGFGVRIRRRSGWENVRWSYEL
jgi:cytochrome P450